MPRAWSKYLIFGLYDERDRESRYVGRSTRGLEHARRILRGQQVPGRIRWWLKDPDSRPALEILGQYDTEALMRQAYRLKAW